MQKKNTKLILIAAAVIGVLALIGGGIFAYQRMNQEPVVETPQEDTRRRRNRVTEPVNVIDVSERPYLQISPLADGRNVEILVKEVKKPANELEYELEYQAGSLLQGAFGAIMLDTIPAKATILLGSCSAGGACTYHQDVQGGTLLTRYTGVENYALKSEWNYIDNSTRATKAVSKDEKFSLTSTDLGTQRYIVVFNTPGYASGLTGTPVSDPFSLAVSSTLRGTGQLSITANEEGELEIMGYNGSTWQSFPTEVSGTTATAEVDLMEQYIVVKK